MMHCDYCGKDNDDTVANCAGCGSLLVAAENHDRQALDPRVYTAWQVSVACLIGGPLAATWLIAQNYRTFDDDKKRKLTLLLGGVSMIVLIAFGFILPKNSPGTVLAALVAAAARWITDQRQGPQIKSFRDNGGKIASWWNAVGVGITGLIATFAVVFILILA